MIEKNFGINLMHMVVSCILINIFPSNVFLWKKVLFVINNLYDKKLFCCVSDAAVSKNLLISEAFLRLFVETVGHFGDHITVQQDGQKIFMVSTLM